MNDFFVELGKSPSVRRLVKTLGLPLPLPEPLRRERGGAARLPLADRVVAFGGKGELASEVAATLAGAGADPFVTEGEAVAAFSSAGEAYGRPAKPASSLADSARLHGLVFDGSTLSGSASLRAVYDFFHGLAPRLARSGRVVVLGRAGPLETQRATAQAALDGFVRSLAKELGRTGVTANLVLVESGAEPRLGPVLRYLLSAQSAFVTAQPLVVSRRARALPETSLVRSLEQKVALVTGAARGIGAATARALSAEGARVLCLDRPEDAGPTSQLARELGGTPVLVDITAPTAPEVVRAALRAASPAGLDVLIHNAGITRDKTLARMAPDLWDQVLGVNLEAATRLSEALDGELRPGGRVVCLASIAGLAGNVGQTAYAASKAGFVGFVRAEAVRLADRGVTVNAVAPGFIETRMTAAIPVAIREVARRLSALGQGGLPEDVAQAIAFLASPGAQGITGGVLRVCGGAFVGA